jgi:hypothetical protein
MAYTLQDLAFGVGGTPAAPLGGVWAKLAGRQDLVARGVYGWLQEAILELSRNYRFEQLEKTGPLFTCTPGIGNYAISNFEQPADSGKVVNLIPSLFRYFSYPINATGANAGSTLSWKTIDALELMLNTPGIPTYFTRYSGQIWIAPLPITPLTMYLRYQIEHSFTSAAAPTDPFLLPNEWKDIAEYSAAIRGATNIRMLDYASQYHQTLFGDPDFQRSSGGTGQPGLIFRRISQMEGDSQSQMRQIRVQVSRP